MAPRCDPKGWGQSLTGRCTRQLPPQRSYSYLSELTNTGRYSRQRKYAHGGTQHKVPFTRFIAGPADYTVCYYSDRIKTTRSHQLALPVVYYSPFQFLFWYDKPSDYQGEPEVEFFKKVPTVWDDTKVIDGRIGEFVSVARQSGDEWFLGSITNGQRVKYDPTNVPEARRALSARLYNPGAGKHDVRSRTVW